MSSRARQLRRLCHAISGLQSNPAANPAPYRPRFQSPLDKTPLQRTLRAPKNQEFTPIRRPFRAPPTVQKDGPRSNRDIRVPKVQLIDAEGKNVGIVATFDALAMAEEAAEARKKQKIVEIKEIKMRPGIDDHDYDVKMRAVNRFFEEGDKVKITLRFRGREMAHQELGMKLLDKVREETAAIAKVEAEPKLEGRQMMMVLAPK